MRRLFKRNGQSTLEYAVIIAVVITAVVLMGWGWFKGAYQRRLMDAGDDLSGGGQFDDLLSTINVNQTRTSTTNDTITGTGSTVAFHTDTTESVTRTGNTTTPDLATRAAAH